MSWAFGYLSLYVQLKEKIVGAYEALKKAIFIIASLLVIFVAVRNSLIWWEIVKLNICTHTYTHARILHITAPTSYHIMYAYGYSYLVRELPNINLSQNIACVFTHSVINFTCKFDQWATNSWEVQYGTHYE